MMPYPVRAADSVVELPKRDSWLCPRRQSFSTRSEALDAYFATVMTGMMADYSFMPPQYHPASHAIISYRHQRLVTVRSARDAQ